MRMQLVIATKNASETFLRDKLHTAHNLAFKRGSNYLPGHSSHMCTEKYLSNQSDVIENVKQVI